MRKLLANTSNKVIIAAFAAAGAISSRADFTPIRLTADSYNHDIVVEKTASPPLVPATTATMEGGLANRSFTWYERGYRPEFPTTGLPKAGTWRDSEMASDHQYQFPPTYKENNVVLIDSQLTNATLRLVNPSTCASLSFLVGGGNGGGKVGYTIHHKDDSVQKGSFTCPDWLNGLNAAYTGGGRINVDTFNFDLTPGNPRLYASDVALTNTGSPVTSVGFSYVSGAGHCAIFAVSGCAGAGELFVPFLVTGYNQDIVVEADATSPGVLTGVTTAAMDDGSANAGHTLYEQGYYPPAPTTGLPAAGTTITAAAAPDHHYILAPSFAAPNVALIDRANPTASITPTVPARYARLSFLTAAGNGPVTNLCIVQHRDGGSETNRFISPDWLASAPAALSVNGRVKLSQKFVDGLDANGPRLFAADLNLTNITSPVTNLVVSYAGGGLNSHAVIFALSGTESPAPPIVAAKLSVSGSPETGWTIHTTAPGRLQSTTVLAGDRTVWQEEGQISAALRITSGSADAKFYRVISP